MQQRTDIERLRVDNLSIGTSLLVRAAIARGLTYRILPEKLIELSDGARRYYFRGTITPCNSMVSSWLSNNKFVSRHILREAGIAVPHTVTLRQPSAWSRVLRSKLNFPLAVKPVTSSHGHGGTMNIRHPGTLKKAVQRAFAYLHKHKSGNRVLVEEYIEGDDLRLLVIGQKVVSVVKREPAYVIGDGERTINELIKEFNNQWQSKMSYNLPLCPIPIDTETTRCLRAQKKNYRYIPTPGEKVYVRWNANVSTGGRSIDITDQTSPALKDLAIQVANLLSLKVTGVDMLCQDYTKNDASKANTVVLEANAAPGFDINQLPFEGAGQNIADPLLDVILEHPVLAPQVSSLAISTVALMTPTPIQLPPHPQSRPA